MARKTQKIADLSIGGLVSRIGLSRGYSSLLLNRLRTPSLDVAAKIEAEFGVPASSWITDRQPNEAA